MKNKGAIIMFALVGIIVGLSIFLAVSISNRSDKNTENSIDNKMVENTNIVTITKNEIENIVIENSLIDENELQIENVVEEVTSPTEKDKTSEVSIIDYTSDEMKQKAKDLVSKDWGKDDTVYFYVDDVREDGTYDVSVRDKATTNEILRYFVDLNKKTVKIQ